MIISLTGSAGSGKDLVGKIIQLLMTEEVTWEFNSDEEVLDYLYRDPVNNNWEIKKFADKLKDIVCILIGCTREQLEDRVFKEKPLSGQWAVNNTRTLTPRIIMQQLATEGVRDLIHPDTWVNALLIDYKHNPNWIITDTRFPNELKAIKDKGGISIKINRSSIVNKFNHISEEALDHYDFDHYIDNDKGIIELINKVKQILIKESLLQ